ncbi:putative leucine-rich repeat-containing protein DDB_G0290503 [Macrosteles quadrilineatus]|uniref:putative leucine-rich repeat-containing protein DDB_G0290503 n=1 Tax=Macrosteles quadrilineatus TaxID=74068 RepID=UPI0023E0BB8A|nr:putative leucine-rich repeat-containing protein DDB_G0290503 [Macrosteles quadrilineatus]
MSARSSKKASREKAKQAVLEESPKYTYTDMLMLRAPPPSVPRPRGARVPGGLPLWETAPLNAKLPLMSGPDGPLVFTRGKLGVKLWKSSPGVTFELSDPYNNEVKFDYESVHDHHLRAWLRNPKNLQVLKKQGLVVPQLRATCSVDQYNNYRHFLYKLYSNSLRNDIEQKENLAKEKLMVGKAIENAEKEAARLKKLEESTTVRRKNMSRLEHLEMERLLKCKKRLQRVIEKAAAAEKKKEEELEQRKERMDAFDRKIRSRIEAAQKIERQNKIKAMKLRYKQDVEMKKLFEKRSKLREMEMKQKAEARWKKKVDEQLKQIEKEKFLYEKRKTAMEQERQQYVKAMEKEWARMEDELSERKCRTTLEKVRMNKRKQTMKQIMRSVSEAYASNKSIAFLSQDEETLATLNERIQQTLREIRYDLEPYIVIAHAKSRLEKQENVPLPVSAAIKYLLEQVIVEYTANQFQPVMTQIAKKVLTTIDELKTQTEERPSVFSRRTRSSSSEFVKNQSLARQKVTRISNVELVIPIHKSEDEFTVDRSNLRRTRDRPPTPMPSVTTFTEAIFRDQEPDEFYEVPADDFIFYEQAALNKEIQQISNKMLQMIPSRVKSVIESRSYDRISVETVNSLELPDNKPVARLCSMLLFDESPMDITLTRIVDRIILGFMQDINMTPSYLRLRIRQMKHEMRD